MGLASEPVCEDCRERLAEEKRITNQVKPLRDRAKRAVDTYIKLNDELADSDARSLVRFTGPKICFDPLALL